MKALVLAGLVVPFLSMGAPASFEVRGAEVEARLAGGKASARIVYDLSVRDAACGWFLAEVEGLPGGAGEPKAVLVLDGKEFPASVEDSSGKRSVQAFRDAREEGARALEAAKSVRLVLAWPEAACAGPEFVLPVLVPRPEYWRENGDGEPRKDLPRLSVRFDAESEEAKAEVRATFKSVPRGARLVLRSDPRSAGVSILK